MIDWVELSLDALWIVGLSIVLASFSIQYWIAKLNGISLSEQLEGFWWQITSSVGFGIFCLSFAIQSKGTLDTVVWTGLLILYIWRSGWVFHKHAGK